MSSPTPGPTVSVQPEAVAALAAELAVLAGELADDASLCRSAAGSLRSSLPGEDGWTAGSTATIWADLADAVAARAGAVAATLLGAMTAYAAADAAIAAEIASARRGERVGPP